MLGGVALAVVVSIMLGAAVLTRADERNSSRTVATALSTATQADGSRRPRIVKTVQLSTRMLDLTIDSPALDARTTVRLLLPTRYAAQPRSQWPVLYLFHGCCDNYLSWTRSTDVEKLSAGDDILVVMPDGGKVGFYSDWQDGPGWERFHTRELPWLLTQHYRAGHRQAVAGNSMGGFGALSYAAQHPGRYAAAASFSGIVHTRLSAETSQAYLGLVQSQGEDPLALWGDHVSDAEVWAAHNPYDLATRLRGTRLFLSVGNGQPGPLDPPGAASDDLEAALHAENQALRSRLQKLRIPARFSFYGPGRHDWPYWQRELHRAWPLLVGALV